MEHERIGFDRLGQTQLAAAVVECSHCGFSAPLSRCEAWPRIVVLNAWHRTPLCDALGLCPGCAERQKTASVVPIVAPDKEPQGTLF